jgi:hypothetical protein
MAGLMELVILAGQYRMIAGVHVSAATCRSRA